MLEKTYKKKHLTSFQLIILGFAGVILLGTVLLMLPFSSAEKVITPFHEALFTATSAVCVTGLVVKDTGSYWSLAGQTIILALIQTGGLGVVTVAASVSLLSGKKISLMQRSTMQDAISAPKVGGIVRLTRFILRGTFLIEAAGTVLLLPVFMGDYGKKGIWMSVFHSISAFCNAGFDILGTDSSMFPSLTGYSGNILINLVIMLLIITGGIGFLTWDDIYTNKIIKIDIDYVLALDENKKIDRRKLQDSISKIDILFRPIFKVKDRTFTVLETSTTIVDEILHFSFELDFVDCLSDDEFDGIEYELMQNLEMTWR